MSSLFADLRYAVRILRNTPGFSLVALLTLALGIGANTAIFSLVNATLLKTPDYPDAERIVNIWEKPPAGGRDGASTLNFMDWRIQNTVFEGLAAQSGGTTTMIGEGDPIQFGAAWVSPNYFQLLRVKAALGRTFDLPADLNATKENGTGTGDLIVISHKAWQTRFGGRKDILGYKVTLHSAPRTVIGVLPKDSPFDRGFAEVWFPYTFEPKDMTRDYRWFRAIGRLKNRVTLEQARSEMSVIAARLAKDYPGANKGRGITIDRFIDQLSGDNLKRSLLVLMSAVAAILLIGCANLANLTLVRTLAREKEIALRASLGAGRWRLIRHCLTENLLLSLLGGALGLGVGYAFLKGLLAMLPAFMLPAEANVAIDLRVLVFTLAISTATAVLFGIVPAFHAASPNLTSSIKEAGRTTSSKGRRGLRGALVAIEVALAFILLTGAGLLIRSFEELTDVETGFDGTNVLTMNVPFMMSKFKEGTQASSYARRILNAVKALPGVREVAVTTNPPLGGGRFSPIEIVGQASQEGRGDSCVIKMISEDYFLALRIRLKSGRNLAETDAKGAPPVAVINEAMAKKFFKNENPIGQRIVYQEQVYAKRQMGQKIAFEVVGVVGDEMVRLGDPPAPVMYLTFDQQPSTNFSLMVKSAAAPDRLVPAIRHAVQSVDSGQAVTGVSTMDHLKAEIMSSSNLRTILLTIFAAIALALAAVGIYGVIAYSVAQQTHEMGIRLALGASRRNIVGLVIRQGLIFTFAGLFAGVIGSVPLTRLIKTMLYGVDETDPVTLSAVIALLAGIALLACYLPARRATRIDPLVALRQE